MKKALYLLVFILCLALVSVLTSCDVIYEEATTTTTANHEQPVEPPHEHQIAEANCNTPDICIECDMTEGEPLGHFPDEDDGDCTTAVNCTVCEEIAVEDLVAHEISGEWQMDETGHWRVCQNDGCLIKDVTKKHRGGTATCVSGKVCDICEFVYTEENPLNHIFDTESGKCLGCGEAINIDATEMTPEELKAKLVERLALDITDIEITLNQTTDMQVFTAIRKALINTYGLENGSVNLTLLGVTEIPAQSQDISDPAIFGLSWSNENIDDPIIWTLGSITLPDVETIGDYAFSNCKGLEILIAPELKTVGAYAFQGCSFLTTIVAPKIENIGVYGFGLTSSLDSIDLPEITQISESAFYASRGLNEIYLPKVTVLADHALDTVEIDDELTVYLTSDEQIVVHKYTFYTLDSTGQLSSKVNLVLNANKVSEVIYNDDGTATWTTIDSDGDEISFTFRNITFE